MERDFNPQVYAVESSSEEEMESDNEESSDSENSDRDFRDAEADSAGDDEDVIDPGDLANNAFVFNEQMAHGAEFEFKLDGITLLSESFDILRIRTHYIWNIMTYDIPSQILC